MRIHVFLAPLVLLVGSSLGSAQEVEDGISQGPVMQGPVMEAPIFGPPPNGQPIGIGFSMPIVGGQSADETLLLHNPSVVKDLELTESQVKQLLQVRSRYAKKIDQLTPEIMEAQRDPDRLKKITKLYSDLEQEKIDELKKVLLAHQFSRLEQVAIQKAIERKGGPSQALQSGLLASKLKITDSQKQEFQEIHQKLLEDLATQKSKLVSEARDRVLATLTPQQRSKFESLIGNKLSEPKEDQIEFLNGIRSRQKAAKESEIR